MYSHVRTNWISIPCTTCKHLRDVQLSTRSVAIASHGEVHDEDGAAEWCTFQKRVGTCRILHTLYFIMVGKIVRSTNNARYALASWRSTAIRACNAVAFGISRPSVVVAGTDSQTHSTGRSSMLGSRRTLKDQEDTDGIGDDKLRSSHWQPSGKTSPNRSQSCFTTDHASSSLAARSPCNFTCLDLDDRKGYGA